MTSRRKFIGMSSLAVVGTACKVGDARSQQTRRDAGGAGPAAPPPAIAALSSMKADAKPITNDERRARIEKAKQLMQAQKLDALMLTGGTSLAYYTNIRWGLSERLLALVIPVAGTPFVVCPKFEHDRAMEQVKSGPLDQATAIMTWEEHQSPYQLIADGLKARGKASPVVGVEETVRWLFSDGLAHAMPAARLTSGTLVTAGCRVVKSDAELALMRLAATVTWKAYEAAYKSLREGMTQNDFGELVAAAHKQLGFSGGAGVQVAEYSALPHGSVAPQTIREGSILLIDGGGTVDGYQSDISRTFVLGKPTDKMKKVFDIVHQAQTTAVKTAKPGLECQAVDAAARKVITDAGYGPDYKYFGHRVGHGMGMDGHEWPYLVRGNTLALAPGMTFSDEPGIYIPGEFGVRLEDDMVITADGAELMTLQSPSLENPFGSGSAT
jgi:Xaa-Pro dipeptidase